MFHTWIKDCVKHNGHNVEPIHIIPSGSAGTDKTHLEKVIQHAILLFYLGLQEYQQ